MDIDEFEEEVRELTECDEEAECPQCPYVNEPMGKLGERYHYMCRSCGWVYSD